MDIVASKELNKVYVKSVVNMHSYIPTILSRRSECNEDKSESYCTSDAVCNLESAWSASM